MKYITNAPNAPEAIGPYSQAVLTGNLMFLSGQVPLNPASGKIESEDCLLYTSDAADE